MSYKSYEIFFSRTGSLMIVNIVIFYYKSNKSCFAVFKIITKLKFELKKKLKNLKIHIKASFNFILSPIMDIHVCSKVKSYVTFKNTCQI